MSLCLRQEFNVELLSIKYSVSSQTCVICKLCFASSSVPPINDFLTIFGLSRAAPQSATSILFPQKIVLHSTDSSIWLEQVSVGDVCLIAALYVYYKHGMAWLI